MKNFALKRENTDAKAVYVFTLKNGSNCNLTDPNLKIIKFSVFFFFYKNV